MDLQVLVGVELIFDVQPKLRFLSSALDAMAEIVFMRINLGLPDLLMPGLQPIGCSCGTCGAHAAIALHKTQSDSNIQIKQMIEGAALLWRKCQHQHTPAAIVVPGAAWWLRL